MGSVRMVDRELAEGFSTEFIHLSTILCEDLTKSLWAHQERIKSASKELESGLLRHLDTPLLSICNRTEIGVYLFVFTPTVLIRVSKIFNSSYVLHTTR